MQDQQFRSQQPGSITIGLEYEQVANVALSVMKRLVAARTWPEHEAVLQSFREDMTMENQLVHVEGKDRVRAILPLAPTNKMLWFINQWFEPQAVQVSKVTPTEDKPQREGRLVRVSVVGIVHLNVRKTLLLPGTYLLPDDIPLHITATATVDPQSNEVESLTAYSHNMLGAPLIMKILFGGFLASTGKAIGLVGNWVTSSSSNMGPLPTLPFLSRG